MSPSWHRMKGGTAMLGARRSRRMFRTALWVRVEGTPSMWSIARPKVAHASVDAS
ncbi:hypothetical protein ACIHCQ_01325 [Streptomyces sp. NPDC052236]|uniref:hypothetical protein n=1 Tax=Streptomyces sp. NPDC052236 TaxID=3365686 RepID=UPI0037CE81A4